MKNTYNNLINLLNTPINETTTNTEINELLIPVLIFIGVIILIIVIVAILNHKFRDIKSNSQNKMENNQENSETSNTLSNTTNTVPNQIELRCPHCGSTHIEFVTEYHKCIWLRLICNAFLIIISILFVSYLANAIIGRDADGELPLIIFIGILYLLIQAVVFYTESKTHVQGVCRACGHIWPLN